MSARSKATDVREVAVLREEHATIEPCSVGDFTVRTTAEPFIAGGIDVMSSRRQKRDEAPGQILVELDSHEAAIRQTFSRASSAAYAIAALMSSGFRLG